MPDDYYALLGVEPDASDETILQAYRERAAEHHPDVSDAEDAEETFRRLNQAKAVLTDPERRRAYDRLGHERFVNERGADADTQDGAERPRRSRRPSGPDPEGEWPLGVGALIDQLFGGGPRVGTTGTRRAAGASRPPGAGDRFEVDLESLFRRAAGRERGASTTTSGAANECPKCRGRGTFVHVLDTGRGRQRRLEACERCGGDGTVPA